MKGGKFMAVKHHQISLSETFSDCQNMLIDNTPSFFQILSEHFNLNDFIPLEFYSAFYRSFGRKRIYPLHFFLPLSFRRFFPFPQILYFFFFLTFVKNYGIFTDLPKFRMLLYCLVSNTILSLTLSECSN